MKRSQRLRPVANYVSDHWPRYSINYGALILLLFFFSFSAQEGWWGLASLSAAVAIIEAVLLIVSLWAAYRIYSPDGIRPHHLLFDVGQISAGDRFAIIDLGERERAIELASRLTTGRAAIVDVYSPQWTRDRALARMRARLQPARSDPRLEWRASEIKLLPLPDRSVSAVILCLVLSEFWQKGDRLTLLKEIFRILAINGRLLVAERSRTPMNWLAQGAAAASLPSAEQWANLLKDAGFQVEKTRDVDGLVHVIRADKLAVSGMRQLTLDFGPF